MAAAAQHERVVVIGAGVSGLVAANELSQFSPLVLESEPNVGGRTLAVRFEDGNWVNLGAQWLAGDTLELAQKIGVEVLMDPLPPPGLFIKGKRHIHRNPLIWFLRLPFSLRARWDLAVMALRLKRAAARVEAGDAADLDRITLAEWLGDVHPDVSDFVSMWATMAGARRADEVTARAGLDVVAAVVGKTTYHGAPYHVARGGTSMLAEKLAEPLGDRIVRGAEVLRVSQTPEAVEILYRRDGREQKLTADRCVVTTPAPIAERICAGLPAAKQEALAATRWSRTIGAAIVVEGASQTPWEDVYWIRLGGPVIVNVLNPAYFLPDGERPAGRSVLTISISGIQADEQWDVPDDQLAERIRLHFETVFPEARDRTTVSSLRRWDPGMPTVPGGEESRQARAARWERVSFGGDWIHGIGLDYAIASGRAAAREVESEISTNQTKERT